MGSGAWTTMAYNTSMKSRGFNTTNAATLLDDVMSTDTSQVYSVNHLHPTLDPKNVKRECCDTTEHPETIPVILALDVTGSMGPACKACAAQLNEIMTSLYQNVKDVEFLVMGIGDLACDKAPIQASQFESDIRILDQMMNVYFGGSLYQDIATQKENAIRHRDAALYDELLHPIAFTEGKFLDRLYAGNSPLVVNTVHHQAIKDVAPGFAVMGRCEDGIIEAIWNPNEKFLWGVQWHPEKIWDIEASSAQIFQAFIDACK